MSKENAVIKAIENDNIEESFDFDALERKLQSDLDSQLSELEFLKNEKENIGSPENLGNTVMNVVWEQFLNQMAATAGEDFVKENRGLRLDLRDEAHIQTTENFADGKIATHNDKIDYQKRYDDWQDNFQKNSDGTNKKTYDNRTDTYKETLKTKKSDGVDARAPFDKDRPKGSKSINKDHTVSAAEIIRDPKANAHLDKQEQIGFANSEKNLVDLDSRANISKGDSKMDDWLNTERDGQKPAERFPINEEELRERDKIAREEYEKLKDEGERKSIEAGKKSQKEEAFKIGGKALRTLVMQLLAELAKEIFGKLIKWFKSTAKNIETLIEHIKIAISSFVSKLKTHLVNAGSSVMTTIAQAIWGPIVSTIRKTITLLKQGWKSLKEAVDYLKKPDSKNKPIGVLMLEVGKIVTAGLSAVGAIVLGEVIEKGLMTVPFLAFEIPILGSLASLIGLFVGAVVSGIIGAIAINLIDKLIAKQQKAENTANQVNKGNEILNTQNVIIAVNEKRVAHIKSDVHTSIKERHYEAANAMMETVENIVANCSEDGSIQEVSDDIDKLFEELEDNQV